MNKEFVAVYGNVGLLNKAGVLRRVMRQNHLERGETYYIGDEVRDIEAAHHTGVKIAVVAWGYNNTRALHQHQPDWLINEPDELVKLFADR